MNEKRLTPRQQYEVAYCQLRIGNGSARDEVLRVVSDEVLDCAVLSYDNRFQEFNGWMNKKRWMYFFSTANDFPLSEWTPF